MNFPCVSTNNNDQLAKEVAKAHREGILPELGCLSYNYELPEETIAAAAAAKAASGVVKVEGEEDVGGGGFLAGDECYNEGQIVWVRGGAWRGLLFCHRGVWVGGEG